MFHCKSICCFCCIWLLVGPHTQSPGTQRESLPSPTATCLAVSFCFVVSHTCTHTAYKSVNTQYTDWFTDYMYIHNVQTGSLTQMCKHFLFCRVRYRLTETETGKERGGKRCVLWHRSKWEVLEEFICLWLTWVIYPYIRQQAGGWRTEGEYRQEAIGAWAAGTEALMVSAYRQAPKNRLYSAEIQPDAHRLVQVWI